MTLGYYIAQLRPIISLEKVRNFDLKERNWDHVVEKATQSKHNTDAHYVKALRAMKVGEETWGNDVAEGQIWLKAAVKFAEEFQGWGGFSVEGEME